MKRIAVALFLLGWTLYTLGYQDHDGRFILNVQAEPMPDRVTCEAVRDSAAQLGWVGLFCAPDDPRER